MKMKKYTRVNIIIILLFSIIFSGFGCRNNSESEGIMKIKMWGVFDNSNEIYPFIKAYQAKYPGVQIDYQKKMFSEYENILLNGFVDGTGPDIFVMHNTWLPKYKKKISIVPEDIMSINEFNESFVSVTAYDLTDEEGIYALPLYVDTLGMYYNYDHYRSTKNGMPSNNWSDFSEDIKRLNRYDLSKNEFVRSAVALGTENNVNQAIDVLYQLFLQYGVNFYNDDLSRAVFSNREGISALEHYLSYAEKSDDNYSWTLEDKDDIYEFVNGEVSTIIGYSYLYDQIAAQSRTKGLDFRVAKMPQIDPSAPVTYADYWAYTVRRMDDSEEEQKMRHAWNFIKSFVSEDSARSYFDMTHRPTARKALIEEQEKDPQFGNFVNQVRYADSIKNYDREKYEILFKNAIEKIREEGVSLSKALSEAEEGINVIVSVYANS